MEKSCSCGKLLLQKRRTYDTLPDMKTSALEDIGLTKAEITVYLSLLSLGTTTAGPIIRDAKLYPSIVYSALESLVTKGFVAFVM